MRAAPRRQAAPAARPRAGPTLPCLRQRTSVSVHVALQLFPVDHGPCSPPLPPPTPESPARLRQAPLSLPQGTSDPLHWGRRPPHGGGQDDQVCRSKHALSTQPQWPARALGLPEPSLGWSQAPHPQVFGCRPLQGRPLSQLGLCSSGLQEAGPCLSHQGGIRAGTRPLRSHRRDTSVSLLLPPVLNSHQLLFPVLGGRELSWLI